MIQNIKERIITLSGSTKFKSLFIKEFKRLTSEGYLVISLDFFEHSDDIEWNKKQRKLLKIIHFYKIDLCNILFVINKNGYIGKSTKQEIKYAKQLGKEIRYLEN